MLLENVKEWKCPSWLASASVCVEEHEVTFDGLDIVQLDRQVGC
jgi:hypothetical protein